MANYCHNPPADMEAKQLSDKFSVFHFGYINNEGKAVMQVIPYAMATIKTVAEYILDPQWAGKETAMLRTITDHDDNSRYKMLNFRFVTFSALLEYRNKAGVIAMTPYIVLDIDGEDILEAYPDKEAREMVLPLRQQLREDSLIDIALDFTSPNGDGLKAVVYVGDRQGLTQRECFDALSLYIYQRYHIRVDKSGSDSTRACFLPHDRTCYVAHDMKKLQPPRLNLRLWLEESRRLSKAQHNTSAYYTGNASDAYQRAEQWVSRRTVYAKGSRNTYVFRCGCLLSEFGVPEYDATEWAVNRFDDLSEREITATIASSYRHSEFNSKQFKK